MARPTISAEQKKKNNAKLSHEGREKRKELNALKKDELDKDEELNTLLKRGCFATDHLKKLTRSYFAKCSDWHVHVGAALSIDSSATVVQPEQPKVEDAPQAATTRPGLEKRIDDMARANEELDRQIAEEKTKFQSDVQEIEALYELLIRSSQNEQEAEKIRRERDAFYTQLNSDMPLRSDDEAATANNQAASEAALSRPLEVEAGHQGAQEISDSSRNVSLDHEAAPQRLVDSFEDDTVAPKTASQVHWRTYRNYRVNSQDEREPEEAVDELPPSTINGPINLSQELDPSSELPPLKLSKGLSLEQVSSDQKGKATKERLPANKTKLSTSDGSESKRRKLSPPPTSQLESPLVSSRSASGESQSTSEETSELLHEQFDQTGAVARSHEHPLAEATSDSPFNKQFWLGVAEIWPEVEERNLDFFSWSEPD